MASKSFGTDGVRGRVGQWPMTPEYVLKLGWAAGRVLVRLQEESKTRVTSFERPSVLIGKDTRLSGYVFESALESGFASAGVDVLLVGPLPTPGIAYLTQTFRAAAGVVISASHNSYLDNGVKFFSYEGQKLPDSVEAEIEAMLDEPMVCEQPSALGKAKRIESAAGRYIEFCKSTVWLGHGALRGMHIVLDCAHGAGYYTAPNVFRELGAQVTLIGAEPDGLNINDARGSTHPETLQRLVVEQGADIGIALDGDGDRCLMVDEQGELVDGDQLVYVIAMDRYLRGELKAPVVGTQMSNLGLALAFQEQGIDFQRTKVGDRYVFERLKQTGANIGGESSGHVLCLDKTTTGDGIVCALQVLGAMLYQNKPLKELVAPVKKCPQTLINVPIQPGSAAQLMASDKVQAIVKDQEAQLGDTGRVVLRPSGTEPLLRVMVEALDSQAVERSANAIAAIVKQAAQAVVV